VHWNDDVGGPPAIRHTDRQARNALIDRDRRRWNGNACRTTVAPASRVKPRKRCHGRSAGALQCAGVERAAQQIARVAVQHTQRSRESCKRLSRQPKATRAPQESAVVDLDAAVRGGHDHLTTTRGGSDREHRIGVGVAGMPRPALQSTLSGRYATDGPPYRANIHGAAEQMPAVLSEHCQSPGVLPTRRQPADGVPDAASVQPQFNLPIDAIRTDRHGAVARQAAPARRAGIPRNGVSKRFQTATGHVTRQRLGERGGGAADIAQPASRHRQTEPSLPHIAGGSDPGEQ
jgi:hypothetical protein